MIFDLITGRGDKISDEDEKPLTDIAISGGSSSAPSAPSVMRYGKQPSVSTPSSKQPMWSASESETTATGSAKEAFDYYVKKGVDRKVAAGIVGNLHKESNLNPRAVGDNGTSYGVAQWHNDRVNGLKAYAKKQGRDWQDRQVQLDYVLAERPDIIEKMKSAKDEREATMIFTNEFERPNPKYADYNTRMNTASSLHKMRYGGPIPRKAEGGQVPSKENAKFKVELNKDGAGFTRNWAKKRAQSGFMGTTSNDATGIATPILLNDTDLNKKFNGKAPEKGTVRGGFYNYDEDKSYLNSSNPVQDIGTMSAHESTHDWQATMEKNHKSGGPLQQSYSNIEKEQKRVNKAKDSYYGSPEEVHARIMEGRYSIGINPGEKFNKEHLENVKLFNPRVYNDLKKTLDDKAIIDLFNKTVMNDKPSNSIVAAKFGGVPRYKYGGIPKKATGGDPPIGRRLSELGLMGRRRVSQQPSYERPVATPVQPEPAIVPTTTVSDKQPLADEGAAFTRSWARERARTGYMGMNQRDVSGIKTPTVLPDAEVQAEAQRTPGNLPAGGRSGGYYDSRTDTSVISDGARDVKSNATHESTHDWQRDTARNHAGSNVNPIRDSYSNIQAEVDRSGKPADKYYGSPNEVHARIMESRAKLGLRPGEVVTQEHIEKLKQTAPRKYQELSRVLDDEGIINSFNKTVMNDKVDNGIRTARYGGVPKFRYGGIPKLEEGGKHPNKWARIIAENRRKARGESTSTEPVGFSEADRDQQRANSGAEFTRDWIKEREQRGDYGLKPSDKFENQIDNPTVHQTTAEYRQNAGNPLINTVAGVAGKNSYRTTNGVYTPPLMNVGTGTVDVNAGSLPNKEISSVSTHETTHQFQNALGVNNMVAPVNDAWKQSEQTINNELQRAGKKQDAYFSDPQEVHARVMQLRQENNLKPGQKVNKKTDISNTRAYKELQKVLDDEGIRNVLNNTVSNDNTDYDPTVGKAKFGGKMRYGKLPKAKFGADQYNAVGTGLSFLGDITESFDTSKKYSNATLSTVGGALKGAGSGAAIGTSILPGIGTVVGAGIGAIAGAIGGNKKAKEEKRMYDLKTQNDTAQFNDYMKSRSSSILQNYPTNGYRYGSY